ncbi:MAG: hypothetical protein FD138_3127 [Planctomycetota bacterium]|nr:MAG: hypothetical protein FD138_3127 [Planctomycetota bacterium]
MMVATQAVIADDPVKTGVAKQLAEVARQFETERTGRTPESVTAVLVDDSLVMTLRGMLSPAEKLLAKSPVGAAQIRELHRQLFHTSRSSLLQEIEVLTGVAVLEATSEVATDTGTVVLVCLLATGVADSSWSDATNEDIADAPSDIWAAKQLADLARQFETHRTGRAPDSVTALLIDDSLVITLRGALSSAEQELSKTPVGALLVRENHRQQFLASGRSLQQQIEVLTGVAVLEATSEVATHSGTVVYVVLLASSVEASAWTEAKSEPTSLDSSGSKGKPDEGGES